MLRRVTLVVLIKPEISAVAPHIIEAYRRGVKKLDEARTKAAKMHCVDHVQAVKCNARSIYKANIAAGQTFITVNHVAPIEHIVRIRKTDMLHCLEPIEAAAPHVAVASVMRRLAGRGHHLKSVRCEVASIVGQAAFRFRQKAAEPPGAG